MNARNELQGQLSPVEIDMSEGTRLGWVDASFKADGETYCFELEITGSLEKRWIGEKRQLTIGGVFVTGADARINILPALTGAHIKALADDVRSQAELRIAHPDLFAA